MHFSDKLNVVDFSTFAQIQQHSTSSDSRQHGALRNPKYRKKHQNIGNNFDLLSLIAASKLKHKKKERTYHKKGATLLQLGPLRKGGGKSRETPKQSLSTLKKKIKKYRKLKHKNSNQQNEKIDASELTGQFNRLSVEDQAQGYNRHAINICETPLEDGTGTGRLYKTIHSRKFREYCDNCTTPELAALVKDLLKELIRFQKRAYEKNPIKANAHRRIVFGFREVESNLRVNKIKLVIMATDCEKCDVEGGIDDKINSIKAQCKSLEVPYVFSLQRRQLAYTLKKNGSFSCVGILDYDGAQDTFMKLIFELENARSMYDRISKIQNF